MSVCCDVSIRPLTHAAETRSPKAVNDVRSRATAQKTGTGIWRRIYAYGADFWSRFLEHLSGLSDEGSLFLFVDVIVSSLSIVESPQCSRRHSG